jgi:hypothetical protein
MGHLRIHCSREVMMLTFARTSVLVAGLVLAACQTPISAHYEYDTTAPFQDYMKFAWVTNEPLIRPAAGVSGLDPRLSPMVEKAIRDAVERNLVAGGYRQLSDPASADLVVSFSVGTREKVQVDSYPTRAGYRYGPYGGYGGWQSDVRAYTEGVLAIDFFDTRSKEVVWHGWATKRLSTSTDQEKRRENVNRVVDAVLEKFPSRNSPQ